ncbi:MAG: hypothetical protein ACRCW9_06465 [Cetobacterium sp.]
MTDKQFIIILGFVLMFNIIYLYFKTKCIHKYEVIEKKTIVDNSNFPVGTKIISRCSKCGKIKMNEF